MNELQLAEEIVSVLPRYTLGPRSEEGEAIRYTVRGWSLKLRSITLSRKSLKGLLRDSAGSVKIEYLKRDLLRSADHRADYRYPRTSVRARRSFGNYVIAT
jgi:hypothetical protein